MSQQDHVENLPATAYEPASPPRRPRLGDLLVEVGLLTPAQVVAVAAYQQHHAVRFGTACVTLGFLSESDLESNLARQLGLAVCDVESVDPSAEVLSLLPEAVVRLHEVIPLALDGEVLVVGMVDPADHDAVDAAMFASGIRRIERRLVTQTTFNRFLATRFATMAILGKLGADSPIAVRSASGADGEAVVVRLVNYLLEQACHKRASDIHIEPYDAFVRVRYRVDGALYTALTPPPRHHAPMVSRIKIMAGMDISKKREPQDGHLTYTVGEELHHFRVSTLPTAYGEKCVMRLLKKEAHLSDVGRLGLTPGQLSELKRVARLPQGLILVTGPTGSGKTTTVHACINYVNDPEINIVTIEDPVEETILGVNHVQVAEKGGVTFASALRSILRQDPDVVFVGEMRDPEVSAIAVRAAQTGHLVLSTLHTNGIVETFSRLADLGVERFLLANAIQLVIAQRLVRKLCPRCARAEPISAGVAQEYRLTERQVASAFHRVPVGCGACLETGYRGRLALYELLVPVQAVRDVLRRGGDETELRAVLEPCVDPWLLDSGVIHALAGVTSFNEVRRVAGAPGS